MIDAPVGLAFAAGLVATVNPCGFAMLPAYLSYFMGLDADAGGSDTSDEPRGSAAVAALRVGGIVSLGFLVVFGTTGLLINAGARAIIDWIPYLALGVGVIMVALGIAMFCGLQLNVSVFKVQHRGESRSNRSIFGFGVSYAVASLSCTLPVFLSVVVGSVASGSFLSGFVTYLAYGAGMSMLLIGVTIAVALAKQGVVRRLKSWLRHVQRVSAAFLVVAGLYITWFWLDDLSSDAGEQGEAAGLVEGWSATLTNWIQANSATVGLLGAGVIVVAALSVVLKRFETAGPDTTIGTSADTTTGTTSGPGTGTIAHVAARVTDDRAAVKPSGRRR